MYYPLARSQEKAKLWATMRQSLPTTSPLTQGAFIKKSNHSWTPRDGSAYNRWLLGLSYDLVVRKRWNPRASDQCPQCKCQGSFDHYLFHCPRNQRNRATALRRLQLRPDLIPDIPTPISPEHQERSLRSALLLSLKPIARLLAQTEALIHGL